MLGAGLVPSPSPHRPSAADAAPARSRSAPRALGYRLDRRSTRIDRRAGPPDARRLDHPLPRRAPALGDSPQPGGDRARAARHPRRDRHGGDLGRRRSSRLRSPDVDGTPDRRGAGPDRPGDPDPALRATADPSQGLADGHRRVGAQRPDRRGAHVHVRSRSSFPATSSRAEPIVDFVTQLGISIGLGLAFGVLLVGDRVEPAGRALGRVGGNRGAGAIVALLLLGRSAPAAAATWAPSSPVSSSGTWTELHLGMHRRQESEMRFLVTNLADVMVHAASSSRSARTSRSERSPTSGCRPSRCWRRSCSSRDR